MCRQLSHVSRMRYGKADLVYTGSTLMAYPTGCTRLESDTVTRFQGFNLLTDCTIENEPRLEIGYVSTEQVPFVTTPLDSWPNTYDTT
jgi:hypothetical protein